MAFYAQMFVNQYNKRPMARFYTRQEEEALLNASMADPRSLANNPDQSLLRSRAYKRNPTCSFTLEVTGKGKLSTSNHEEVKWVPSAPDNASWADTVEYKWDHQVASDGSVKVFPVLVQHNFVARFADEDAIVSSSQDIIEAYLYAIRLLREAGHKVTIPNAHIKPLANCNDVSSDDDESSDDEDEADVIVTVRPRRAKTGWGPAPRPLHTFKAKVDYGCQLYSGNSQPLPFLHAVPGAACGDLLELAVCWEVSSDGTHSQVAKLLRHHSAAACWEMGLVADSVAAVKQVVRAASFSW